LRPHFDLRAGLPQLWHATCNQPLQQRFSTRCKKSETADAKQGSTAFEDRLILRGFTRLKHEEDL
jgi:hypothetical protein